MEDSGTSEILAGLGIQRVSSEPEASALTTIPSSEWENISVIDCEDPASPRSV